MGDCSLDVVLSKIMVVVKAEIEAYRKSTEASEVRIQVEERDKWAIAGISSLREKELVTKVFAGGRLASTFALAEMGELQRDSEVLYTVLSDSTDKSEALDIAVLEHLKESTRSELDCQVCYSLFLDPYTTTCGHTFCRKCIHRVLDHSTLCPVCRRVMAIPPGITAQQAPGNKIISKLLQSLCPEAVAARAEAVKQEESSGLGDMDTPLFNCTLAFPSVPTFLHIFEPRYRLMIRRAYQSESRSFGMLLFNPGMTPQGDLGAVPFYEYGTMLQIANMHLLPDGRSLIETVGTTRFRVLRHGSLDGYLVGKVERIDDVSIAAEEALEAAETTSSTRNFSAQDHFGAPPHHTTPRQPLTAAEVDSLPTRDLMEIGTSFVKKMKEQSAPWLNSRVFQAYGECPTDPALFAWWFASILPIHEAQKYKLLATSSVRERLKICAHWIAALEAQRWYEPFCS